MNKKIQQIKKNLRSKSGAALLITMLLIAGVGALALAISRIVLSEIRISASYADSVIAYQAAETGIEKGLLEFRNNRTWDDKTFSNSEQNYTVLINTKQASPVEFARIDRDKSYTLDISKNTQTINVYWQARCTPTCNNVGIFEYQISRDTSANSEWKLIGNSTLNTGSTDNIEPGVITSARKYLRFRFLTPYANTWAFVKLSSATEQLPSPTFTIDSTGTYQKVKRVLRATLQPATGQVISIFDYTLYAGVGDIAP
ncbi:MAG TPA: hypothetical protein VJJ80_03770 [Patescibacteria group bacterium]|nr:hypothetical protein [Patescibacteria group bacterium]